MYMSEDYIFIIYLYRTFQLSGLHFESKILKQLINRKTILYGIKNKFSIRYYSKM